jgi:oligopeptide transport system ATP-binding protein
MPSAELKGQELPTIPGTPPSLRAIPSGCAFRTRCPYAIERCAAEVPPLLTVAPGRDAACIRRTTMSEREAV